MYKLRPRQQEAVDKIVNFVNGKSLKKGLFVYPTGCHEKGYNIRMADGSLKKVEDIKAGESLMGIDSKPRVVQDLVRGYGKIYKITPLTKAEPFFVNEDHILYLESTTVKDTEINCYPKNLEVSVKEYLKWSKTKKHLYKLKRFSINYNEIQVPVDPYYLGLWLGDGISSCTDIVTVDEPIKKWLKSFSEAEGLNYNEKPKKGAEYVTNISLTRKSGKLNHLKERLRLLGVLNNKHIPEIYLKNSTDIRLKLLAGLIDSDGHLNKKNYEISLSNKVLTEGVLELLNSLGLFSKITKSKSNCSNCNSDYNGIRYRINFASREDIPTKIERKKPTNLPVKREVSRSGFKVEFDRYDDYYGFNLDKDRLYLDWQNIAHHNCGKSIIIANVANKFPNKYFINVTSSKELLKQNYEKFISYGYEATICSSSLGSKDVGKITFATIGTLVSQIDFFRDKEVILLYDEAHTGSKKGSQLDKFITEVKECRLIGTTATPLRLKAGMQGTELKMMNRDRDCIYSSIEDVVQISEVVSEKFWSPLDYKIVDVDNTALELNSSGTDYTLDSLKRYSENNDIVGICKEEINKLINEGRKSILVFLPFIEDAQRLELEVDDCKAVYSGMNNNERDEIVSSFKNLNLTVVSQVNILSTGFDHPELDAIVFARPTNSVTMWYQGIGRGVRTHKNKKDCKVVDISGNFNTFGRIEDINYEEDKAYGGWAAFSGERLLTNYPLGKQKVPTKSSLKKAFENKSKPLDVEIYFGKYKGKKVSEVLRDKQGKQYLAWIVEPKTNFNFLGDKGQKLKQTINNALKL